MYTLLALTILPLESSPALYVGLFVLLVLSGFGLPLPEEVTLLFGGYLAYLEFIEFWPTLYTLIAGIIAADLGGYLLGRYAGEWITEKLSGFKNFAVILKKTKGFFAKHGEKVVIFSRPFIGVRVVVPILAGHFKMNLFKFLVFDIIAAVPWTFALVSVSYYLGTGLDLITEIKEVKHSIYVTIGVAIILWAGLKFIRAHSKDI